MKTFFNERDRAEIVARLKNLEPDAPRRWGSLDAPRMVAHLTDQMRICLGDKSAAPLPGVFRWPGIRYLTLHVLPWPRGRVKGPPEAFTTEPESWSEDLAGLLSLVERFAGEDPNRTWPEHAMFGAMSGEDWGRFCHKHFEFHLQQFGQ
jgi:hypothetical protein